MRAQYVVIVAIVMFNLSGCAARARAPFHVYESPLLAAEGMVQEPRARTFDPSDPGDFPRPDAVYVVNDETPSEWKAKPRLRRGSRKGAQPQAAAVGGRGSARSASSEAATFDAARAAEFAWEMYRVNGVELPAGSRHSVAAIYEHCRKTGATSEAPAVGDLVFFHNVADLNADARNNDWYSHVGIVHRAAANGALEVLAYQSGKVAVFFVDRDHPDAVEVDGEPANSRLRIPTADDPPYTQYYAGQLFAGHCSLLGGRPTLRVVENWQPGMKLD